MLAKSARSLFVALALTVFVSSAAASPVLIDSFNDNPAGPNYPFNAGVTGLSNASTSDSGLSPTETLFGYRHGAVYCDGPNPAGSFGSADLIVVGGRLALGTNSAISPYVAEWMVSYYDDKTWGPVDLVDDDGAPNAGLLIDFLSADADCSVAIYVRGPGTTHAASAKTPKIPVASSAGPLTVFVPFSAFTILEKTTSFDFTNVYSVQLWVYGQENGDYQLDNFRADVPEPASLTLLAVGAGMLLRRRKRH